MLRCYCNSFMRRWVAGCALVIHLVKNAVLGGVMVSCDHGLPRCARNDELLGAAFVSCDDDSGSNPAMTTLRTSLRGQSPWQSMIFRTRRFASCGDGLPRCARNDVLFNALRSRPPRLMPSCSQSCAQSCWRSKYARVRQRLAAQGPKQYCCLQRF